MFIVYAALVQITFDIGECVLFGVLSVEERGRGEFTNPHYPVIQIISPHCQSVKLQSISPLQ